MRQETFFFSENTLVTEEMLIDAAPWLSCWVAVDSGDSRQAFRCFENVDDNFFDQEV